MRKLELHKGVLKEFASLPAKQYRQVVSKMLDLLNDPRPHYSQALSGSDYLRITIGEYRLVYRLQDDSIFVAAFGKRNDDEIYKALGRRN